MSGRDCGYLQGSELSVSVALRAAGAGGEEDAPPPPAPLSVRRLPVRPAGPPPAGWDPVASSLSGDLVPLDDVLGRLLDGLAV